MAQANSFFGSDAGPTYDPYAFITPVLLLVILIFAALFNQWLIVIFMAFFLIVLGWRFMIEAVSSMNSLHKAFTALKPTEEAKFEVEALPGEERFKKLESSDLDTRLIDVNAGF